MMTARVRHSKPVAPAGDATPNTERVRLALARAMRGAR